MLTHSLTFRIKRERVERLFYIYCAWRGYGCCVRNVYELIGVSIPWVFEIFGCCFCMKLSRAIILPNPPFSAHVLSTESGLYTFDSPPVSPLRCSIQPMNPDRRPRYSGMHHRPRARQPLIHGYNNLAAASIPLSRSQRGPSSTKSSARRLLPHQTSLLGYTTSALPKKSSLIALILTNRLNKF